MRFSHDALRSERLLIKWIVAVSFQRSCCDKALGLGNTVMVELAVLSAAADRSLRRLD